MLKHTLKERIFTVLLAGVMTASVITSGCGMFNKESDSDKTSSSSTASQSDSDQSRVLDDDLVVKSENFSLSKNMVAYLFNHYYTSNLTYAEYYQGFDASKSPKDQYYDEENGVTWYDYYMSLTKQYLTQLLVHCEAAKAENMKLDEKDNKDVATTIDSIKKSAEDNNQTLEEYIKKNFGEGVTEESIKEYLEMTALASKYYEKIYNSYQYTDEDYEKYYSEHKTDYQFADFLRFTFSFASAPDSSADSSTDSSQEVSVDKDLKDKAKAYAEDLSKCKTAKAFKDYIKKYYELNPSMVPSSDSETSTLSVEDIIQQQVDSAETEKYAYEVTSEAGKWIFDASREPLDTHVFENENSYTVVMVTKTAYRDESFYKNVRHILITTAENDGSEAKAKAKADEIYDEWKKGDATEDSFAALAEKYSKDPGSQTNGGLYTDVSYGQMVAEFNDWLFDANRKVGDTGIVKTSYGFHIMYFCGNGAQVWKQSVDTVMRKDAYGEDYEKLTAKYTVTFDDSYLNTIEISEAIEESSEYSIVESTDESAGEASQVSAAESKASEASQASAAESTEAASGN